jgi:hypothetical protein
MSKPWRNKIVGPEPPVSTYVIGPAESSNEVPAELPAPLVAFEIDALLAAANIARNLHDDDNALHIARDIIHLRLGIQHNR